MSEITPLTKDQLFEKKIAENTGSDYNVGDISDVVPVTKDQALLKEIALNSAEQSGDITELEGKVADNTSAIEAMVNEYGAKNLLPNNAISKTVADGTITVNSDGSIRTNIATTNGVAYDITDYFTVPTGDYIFSKGMSMGQSQIWLQFFNGSTFVKDVKLVNDASQLITIDYDGYAQIKCVGYIPPSTTIDATVYPMLRDARIKDPTYVPYAMTNKELTNRLTKRTISFTNVSLTFGDGGIGYDCPVISGYTPFASRVKIKAPNSTNAVIPTPPTYRETTGAWTVSVYSIYQAQTVTVLAGEIDVFYIKDQGGTP